MRLTKNIFINFRKRVILMHVDIAEIKYFKIGLFIYFSWYPQKELSGEIHI